LRSLLKLKTFSNKKISKTNAKKEITDIKFHHELKDAEKSFEESSINLTKFFTEAEKLDFKYKEKEIKKQKDKELKENDGHILDIIDGKVMYSKGVPILKEKKSNFWKR